MNRWKSAVLAATAVTLIVTGCSATGDAPAATPETSASPSSTVETATVEQWASLVAEQRNSFDDTQTSWDDATCSSTTAARGAVDCQAMMIAMGYEVQTVKLTLRGAATPTNRTFIGTPPDEVKDLVNETIGAADDAQTAFSAVDTACFDEGIECAGEAMDAERAWNELGDKFAAWEPYM